MTHARLLPIVLLLAVSLCGCGSSKRRLLDGADSQVKLRQIQTRAFDTTDRVQTLRTVMATLQDLGFVLDDASETLGTVSATKLDKYSMRMSVSVRPRGQRQMLVRANAQYNLRAVEDPEPYQQFFSSLSKAMFLAAHQVD
jgi:hypothetical protein